MLYEIGTESATGRPEKSRHLLRYAGRERLVFCSSSGRGVLCVLKREAAAQRCPAQSERQRHIKKPVGVSGGL